MAYRVSKQRFGELVQNALDELPAQFTEVIETTRIEIHDRPTPSMLRASHVAPGHTLLGLYHGRPQTRRNVEDSGVLPDVIYLFQEEIETLCGSEEDLVAEVRRTVLHEIGHHFGLDEQNLDELGYG